MYRKRENASRDSCRLDIFRQQLKHERINDNGKTLFMELFVILEVINLQYATNIYFCSASFPFLLSFIIAFSLDLQMHILNWV